MPMVDVGDVRVIVGQPGMAVRMRVGLVRRVVGAVLVMVVLVMAVEVLVLDRFVGLLVGVALARHEHHAERHQDDRSE